MKFTKDDLPEIEEYLRSLQGAFNLRDFSLHVSIVEECVEDCHTYADLQAEKSWEFTISLHDKFFDCSENDQALTLAHELTHVLHSRIDQLFDAAAGDNEQLKRVYEVAQENFIEAMERVFANFFAEPRK